MSIDEKQNTVIFNDDNESFINLTREARAFISHLNTAYTKALFADNKENNTKNKNNLANITANIVNGLNNDKFNFPVPKEIIATLKEKSLIPEKFNSGQYTDIIGAIYAKNNDTQNQEDKNIENIRNKNKALDHLRPAIIKHVSTQWYKHLNKNNKPLINKLHNKETNKRLISATILGLLVICIGASLFFPQLALSLTAPYAILATLTVLALSTIVNQVLSAAGTSKKAKTGATILTFVLGATLALSLFFPLINIGLGLFSAIAGIGLLAAFIIFNNTLPKEYIKFKKIFKSTSAYDETIKHTNNKTNVTITIENPNPKCNSHNKNEWEKLTAQRPVHYIQSDDSKNGKTKDYNFIRTPSLANPKASSSTDIPLIVDRLKDIFGNENTKSNGGTYNLLTSIYPSFLNPFSWEDNISNKQTISANRIFKAAHLYNKGIVDQQNNQSDDKLQNNQSDNKLQNKLLYIQNIGSNYHTEPLDNHPEACLLADMALLHTLNPSEAFSDYKDFLKNTKGYILHTTQYGKDLRDDINTGFRNLVVKQTADSKSNNKFHQNIKNALIIIVQNKLHYRPEFGNITQVLSIFLQTADKQTTAFGCKSGNERFVDIANKVLLLFEANGLDKLGTRGAINDKLLEFISAETPEEIATNLNALVTTIAALSSQHNIAGPMNLITNSDNGGNSKLKHIINLILIPKIETCLKISVYLSLATILDIIITGIIEAGIFSLASFAALNPITIAICSILALTIAAAITMKIKPEWTKECMLATGFLLISAIAVLAATNSFVTLFTALSAATIVALCLIGLTAIMASITFFNKDAINTNCGTQTTPASNYAGMHQSHKAHNIADECLKSAQAESESTPTYTSMHA